MEKLNITMETVEQDAISLLAAVEELLDIQKRSISRVNLLNSDVKYKDKTINGDNLLSEISSFLSKNRFDY